ncbi:hypothetical protein SAMN05421841_0709 [Chryseobacterium wanjuense]|uniref:Uncharacterized protein n=1 Tax=Chryseobacterium wanjuense TaxID=356305 RepID=A0A1I0NNU8_9FLAO|nr:hypothetical protein [Chryseobacterium wanjuense]SEW03047.1 hypothetical protein SAMN05421841_0709 [Chryseobacterium wanjuense]
MIKHYLRLAGSAQLISVQTRGFVSIPWFSKNYQQVTSALKNPDKVAPDGRLKAVVSTSHYTPDKVGFGVHAATIFIYIIFRDLGQQKVGREFGLPYAVEILDSPRNFKNNRRFGVIDQNYWILHQGKGATLPDNVVICIGAWMYPVPRAVIQELLAKIRETFFSRN